MSTKSTFNSIEEAVRSFLSNLTPELVSRYAYVGFNVQQVVDAVLSLNAAQLKTLHLTIAQWSTNLEKALKNPRYPEDMKQDLRAIILSLKTRKVSGSQIANVWGPLYAYLMKVFETIPSRAPFPNLDRWYCWTSPAYIIIKGEKFKPLARLRQAAAECIFTQDPSKRKTWGQTCIYLELAWQNAAIYEEIQKSLPKVEVIDPTSEALIVLDRAYKALWDTVLDMSLILEIWSWTQGEIPGEDIMQDMETAAIQWPMAPCSYVSRAPAGYESYTGKWVGPSGPVASASELMSLLSSKK